MSPTDLFVGFCQKINMIFYCSAWLRDSQSEQRFPMPCPFTGLKCFVLVQMFWASPKIWLHLVPLQNFCAGTKTNFTDWWLQIIFLSGTKCLWMPQYVNKFLVQHKKFGPIQNILGPVKGQGICKWFSQIYRKIRPEWILPIALCFDHLKSYWSCTFGFHYLVA